MSPLHPLLLRRGDWKASTRMISCLRPAPETLLHLRLLLPANGLWVRVSSDSDYLGHHWLPTFPLGSTDQHREVECSSIGETLEHELQEKQILYTQVRIGEHWRQGF